MGTNKEGADWETVVGNGWQGTGGVSGWRLAQQSKRSILVDGAPAIRKPSNIALFNSFDIEQFIESSCRDY